MRDFWEFLKTPIGKFFLLWAVTSVSVVAFAVLRKYVF